MAHDPKTRADEQLGEMFRSAGPDVSLPPGFEQKLQERLSSRIDSIPGEPAAAAVTPHHRIWFVRAAAAAIAFAVVTCAIWWIAVDGVGNAAADFAAVLNHMRAAKWVAYDTILRPPGESEIKARVLMARPNRSRITWPDGRIHICDNAEAKVLRLSTNTHTARLVSVPKSAEQNDPLDQLQNVDQNAGQFDGTETVGARQAFAYNVTLPQGRMRVLVDVQSELPIRIEIHTLLSDGQPFMMVLENFTWNEAIPDSMFSLQVPEGYTLESLPSEASLIELLRTCAVRGNGVFPARLDEQTVFAPVIEESGHVFAETHASGPPLASKSQAPSDAARKCQDGMTFVNDVNNNGSWRYVGGGVRLGDGSKPVCWWKPAGTSSYRVVYGDLQVRVREAQP